MRKPLDERARELDALFSVETRPNGFDLLVESRGGSDHGPNAARNSEYAAAVELHLFRMSLLGMVLQEVQVASRVAMKMEEKDRRVELDRYVLPLTLSPNLDLRELRLSIGRASAAFGRTDGSDRGNRTKRLLFRMLWPPAATMNTEEIELLLASKVVETEHPTSNDKELLKRVARATARIRNAANRGTVLPPKGQQNPKKSEETSSRFFRDPNVIAWVLDKAAGHCEICGDPAPFLRSAGEPFLEVHHVRPLAEGGPDTTDNAVACCPNCHRQLHYGISRDLLRRKTVCSILRLKDYPKISR